MCWTSYTGESGRRDARAVLGHPRLAGDAGADGLALRRHTPCVEVRAADGTLLVLDCGTGAYGLGQALVGAGGPPPWGHLLLTHTHWDHIQGFPFFAPLRVPGGEWDVYAPGGPGQRLRGVLGGQMGYEYFPLDLGQLAAAVRFHDLGEGGFDAGGVRVTACYLNHPALTLGYRLEAGGAVLVYATDHEPHGPLARPGAAAEAGGRRAGEPTPAPRGPATCRVPGGGGPGGA